TATPAIAIDAASKIQPTRSDCSIGAIDSHTTTLLAAAVAAVALERLHLLLELADRALEVLHLLRGRHVHRLGELLAGRLGEGRDLRRHAHGAHDHLHDALVLHELHDPRVGHELHAFLHELLLEIHETAPAAWGSRER